MKRKLSTASRARIDRFHAVSESNSYQLLEPRLALASVQVIAAGVTNQETLVLQIDGQNVRTWNNIGGNAYAGNFVTLAHSTAGSLSASSVRLAFTNDLYDPANGIDRNVRIDALVIDGVRFETENAQTFSTGTWLPADGVVAGYRQSEFLHADGYFQYSAGSGSGSLIRIRASGDESGEQMELRIDGQAVASFTVTNNWAVYQHVAPGAVDASRIRVAFLNDLYDPANSVDRNLNVDWIAVDGVTYETEGPNVFSTGTWTPASGVTPGFWQSQTLHSEGYFQYETPRSFGTIGLAQSVINVAENSSTATVTIVRTGGSDGTITIDYRTVALSATAGQDFVGRSGTATLLPGEISRAIPITLIDDGVVEGEEQFSLTIDNVQGGATLGAPRTATITIQDNDAIRAAGNGLLGEYFDNPGFSSRFINRVDATVNFNWGTGAPAGGMGADNFSVRWSGRIEPRFTEIYTFRTRSDDGVRLWVNNQLIIDRWIDQAATFHTGTIALQAGVFADIRMEYYENVGDAVAELAWSSARQGLEIVPRSQLYAADPPPVTPGNSLQTQNLFSGLVAPTAMDFSPDGSNLYIAEQRGIIRVARNGNLLTTPFLDFRDRVNGTRDRGLLDIAVHPDFVSNPYVYLLYTFDPPQVNGQAAGTLAGPDGNGNRAGRLTRVTADAATGYTSIVANSEVVIVGSNSTWGNFNAFVNSTTNFSEPPAGQAAGGGWVQDFIATDSESHTVGAIEFGPDGMLYASIGDGTSYNQVDPRTSRVQDLDNLSGKILRVNPLTGRGLGDNPFFNGNADANRSKVWQYGLRNPFRMAFHPGNGKLFIGDVGWTQWEELNSSPPGANFGWPWYEGGNGTSLQTGQYRDLAAAQAFYASGQTVTPAFYALNHAASGINAIVMGDVYTGNAFPASYRDNVFFGDLGQGIIRNIRFNTNGTIAEVQTFATGQRYVVQMVQGPDGNLYFVDLDDGVVGRWTFVEGAGNASPAAVLAAGAPASARPQFPGGGAGIVVATIDSGLRTADPQLAGKLWTNGGEVAGDGIDNDRNRLVDDIHGFDFVERSGALSDPLGHGTFLGSLIAGSGAGDLQGVAPDARLMPLRVLSGAGGGASLQVAEAIRYAVNHGARIISLSIQLDGQSEAIREALRWAEERQVLVIAAAGNQSATEPGSIAASSAVFSNLLSVGAVDAEGRRLPESNRVGTSGAVQLDAPGIAFGPGAGGTSQTMRGTSVAAAILSGAAARIWSLHPLLTADQLRELLVATASPVGSGSDSAGALDLSAALELVSRQLQTAVVRQGDVLTVQGSSGDDTIRFEAGQSSIRVNGLTYPLAGGAGWTHVLIEGLGGADRLTVVGSLGGDDYGLLAPGYASLTTVGQFIRGTGFEQLELLAGDGATRLDLVDSNGNDQLSVFDNQLNLAAGGSQLKAVNFRTTRAFASQGNDTAVFQGTARDERLLAQPELARLVRGAVTVQANRFDFVTADLGGGFDSVIFEGSIGNEQLELKPDGGRLSGANFGYAITSAERTTSYGLGGLDELTILDGPDRETVDSLVLNTFVAGAGYDHRAKDFFRTTLRSSGGTDHVTLRGTGGREVLEANWERSLLSGVNFETAVWGFPSLLIVGAGGGDEARLTGSAGSDWFWSSPTMSVLNTANVALTIQQFADTAFAGNGGTDFATVVDGAGADLLELRRTEASLIGAGYRIAVRDIARLRARSLVDLQPDSLRFLDSDLDYQFERIGDWIG